MLTWGVGEHLDMLGAWDWLVARGFAPENIGIHGPSMGGASATIAIANEPRVRSAWVDAPACWPWKLALDRAAAMFGGILAPIAAQVVSSSIAVGQRWTSYDMSSNAPKDVIVKLTRNQVRGGGGGAVAASLDA